MRKQFRNWLGFGSVLAVLVLLVTPSVRADQGFYILDKSARPGMLVSLSKNSDVVELARTENASSLLGVLSDSQTNLTIQPGQTEVRTGGMGNALVTNVDGDIKVGDPVTVSSVVGFGSKLKDKGWIVGTAQATFNAQTVGAVKSTVTDSAGAKHDVYVGSIPMLIKVTYYNPSRNSNPPTKTVIPEKFQNIIDSIAGHRASQIAVLLAFILLLVGFVIAGFITTTAVKNGITAGARQPLARQATLRRMLQACGLALGILAAAAVGALVVIHLL